MGIRHGTNGNAISALSLNLDAINRLKSEDLADQASEVLARIKQRQHEYEDRDLDDDFKSEERTQQIAAMFMRQATAAAALQGMQHSSPYFANLAATVGNLSFNSNTMCQLNSALLASNSSPSGASGSSGSGVASSPALQSIEPGKGYTYEEQFKQVCKTICFPQDCRFENQSKWSVACLCTFPLHWVNW